MNAWTSDVFQDVRFAARTFAKRPGFTAVAAITLALGIGATTAVFSIVHAVLLRPLPYKDPDRLAAVWITSTREGSLAKIFATYRDYSEFRRTARTLDSVSAATWAKVSGRVLTGFGPARDVLTIPASASFFETLGVTAALGRTFRAEDEGRGCSIVVAHKFWTTRLHADASIVGKSLTLDQTPCTVLGVMPERFSFYPSQTQAWILLGPDFQPGQDGMLVGIFVRLKPGATLAQAETELRGIHRAIHPDGEARDWEPIVRDLHGEFTFLAGRTLRTTLVLVFAAVFLVLLIACLNVANLLLARLSERRRELAVRAALGSGQGRLIRQVLTEGLLLSGLGAALGVAIAYAAVRYFRHANPIELDGRRRRNGQPAGSRIRHSALGRHYPDFRFAPRRTGVASRSGASPQKRRPRIRPGALRSGKAVIAVEMALSFMLLVGASLFLTSALRMGSESLGFNPDRVLAAGVGLPAFRYPTDSERLRFCDRLLERLSRVPGAVGVALASKLPPNAGGNQVLEVQGRPVPKGSEIHDAGADAVSPGFFDALNIPLKDGRVFDDRDRENSQPVAIVERGSGPEILSQHQPVGSTAPPRRRFHALADHCRRGWKPETHAADERNDLGGDAHSLSPAGAGAAPIDSGCGARRR